MIKNGIDISSGTNLDTTVCIIGSGPAGITAAWYLQKAGIDVILIEGSRAYSDFTQSWPDKILLYNGESIGLFATNEPEFLILPYTTHYSQIASERERFYGGTSNHWGGQSRPEDPIDLEKRPGMPGSNTEFPGWPMTRADLDPFYAEASKFCNLYGTYPDNFDSAFWAKELNAQVPVLDGFDTEMYQFLGGTMNFAARSFGGTTIGQTSVTVIQNASLLNIENQSGSVTKLHVASMDTSDTPKPKTNFTITAKAYVLACGAVANARQLLLDDIGNEHDQVGRYFMCHPLSHSQPITTNKTYLNQAQCCLMSGRKLSTNQNCQTATKFTNNGQINGVEGRFIPNADQTRSLGIGRCWFWYNMYDGSSSQYYFEQTPNPDSRVMLSDTVDKVFGQKQTRIDWQISDADEYTYTQTTTLFQKAVSKLGGDMSFASWADVKSELIVNGHHIGTTRMHTDPTQGVVNGDLKVHSLDNLYVAGASVFPSAGISNPTFSIITFSIRLAAHLQQQLAGS
jgi:choline dehydrogenase-like flavoprotein